MKLFSTFSVDQLTDDSAYCDVLMSDNANDEPLAKFAT